MGLLIPSTFEENSKNVQIKRWTRMVILISITALLTWYGKFYQPQPVVTRINDFGVWILPHKNGLGALIALPNDNNDFNDVQTGLRIWVSPPDSLLAFERNGVRYRGKNIVVIGDSLNEALKQDMLTTLDSNGNFFWLGSLSKEQTGRDVSAELKLFGNNPKDYLLDLVYEGHKLRFFGSQTVLDSVGEEPLTMGVMMFRFENDDEPMFKNNRQVQSLIWNGKCEGCDFSRIGLNYEDSYALVSYNKKLGLRVKRMRLKGWNPDL